MKKSRDFEKSISALKKAVEIDPKFAEAHLDLGYNYFILRDLRNARVHLQKAAELKPDDQKFKYSYIRVAEFELREGNYKVAVDYAKKYLTYNSSARYQRDVDEANRILEIGEFAIKGIQNPHDFKPVSLGDVVNKFPYQYFPVLTADNSSMVFIGRQNKVENLFISTNENGVWSEPEPIKEINTNAQEGTCTISGDGKTLIFTACGETKERKVYGLCDLFISHKSGDEWSTPSNMGNRINRRSWESQPALSADGRTLYFVSDRPGGIGGNDIWMTKLNDKNQWTEPENLGPTVNTKRDEIAPFIHANGKTLFFSSEGYLGYGGYDFYKTELKSEKEWNTPENLGYPINDFSDQVGLFITADGTKAFYSNEDYESGVIISSILTSFNFPEKLRPSKISDVVAGKVYDAVTKQPLNAQIKLTNIDSDNLISAVESDEKYGNYLIALTEGSKYALHVDRSGYLYKSLSFDYKKESESKVIELDIYLEPIVEGSIVTLNNIFFESGSFALLPESKTELDKLVTFMSENADLKIEIGGHTDDVGSDDQNKTLSLNRANSVKEFLTKAGIPESRIATEGYGETQPVSENTSEVNKAKNRRIEFKVMKI
ncbi:MAG: OmpA family protein [Flammeovirgaceae bacterium]|nr:OmpA family protein [Flammeovirgaceae bacterium]